MFDNNSVHEFHALADLCVKINVRLANSIFANHERQSLDMKKQAEDISKKYDFFLWWWWWYDDDDKNFPDDVSIKQESDFSNDVSIKQESDNEIDYRETIHYASPRRKTKLQPFTKYLRLTLVFIWNSSLREKFNFYFSRVLC